MYVDFNSPEGQEAFRRSPWMDIPDEEYRAATAALQSSGRPSVVHSSMKNFDKWVNACESIGYLDSATKEGDTYTLIGCGKSLQIKERFDDNGQREVLLWSKSMPTELRKVVGASLEKVLPRLVVQHFTGIKNVTYTDHNNHQHIFEDVGFFPVSVHSNMTRFSDATGRKWMCIASGSDVPNITLAFYKLLYDGRTEMSAMMMPKLIPLDDVKLVKSGVGGEPVTVFELPELPTPSEDFIVSSVEDFTRALPDFEELRLFLHQGDVPDYGYAIKHGMVASSADRPFIASAEKTMREFIGSSDSSKKRSIKSGFESLTHSLSGVNVLKEQFSREEIGEIEAQRALIDLGYDPASADGLIDGWCDELGYFTSAKRNIKSSSYASWKDAVEKNGFVLPDKGSIYGVSARGKMLIDNVSREEAEDFLETCGYKSAVIIEHDVNQ